MRHSTNRAGPTRAGAGARTRRLPEAVEIVKTEYLEVRRQHLYVTHSIDNLDPGDMVTLIPEFTSARYFVPSDDCWE